jgi:SAM-dependent methyltransferase
MPSLSEVAHRRLYPHLSDPNFLVLRSRRLIFSSWIKQIGGRSLKVLDIGGRYQPYRPLLGERVASYVAVDVAKTELVTLIADGQALPFAPDSFDLAIVTQVFDCFPNPHLAAQQIHATLRPGGVLLASIPCFAPKFDSGERWRFTDSGIRAILAPFAKVELVPEVYSAGGLLRAINVALNLFLHFDSLRFVYRLTGCPLLNLLGLIIEKLRVTSNEDFTGNYSVRATKA